jgi:hypothetical protein
MAKRKRETGPEHAKPNRFPEGDKPVVRLTYQDFLRFQSASDQKVAQLHDEFYDVLDSDEPVQPQVTRLLDQVTLGQEIDQLAQEHKPYGKERY